MERLVLYMLWTIIRNDGDGKPLTHSLTHMVVLLCAMYIFVVMNKTYDGERYHYIIFCNYKICQINADIHYK